MLNQSIKNKLYVLYLFALLLILLFMKISLSKEVIDVDEESNEKEEIMKRINVDMDLEIYPFPEKDEPQFVKRVKMSNQDTVSDLLKYLRSKKLISYEITTYSDRLEINHVNNIYPQLGEEWHVFVGNEDITNQIFSAKLENDKVYKLKLIHTLEPQ